MSSASHSRKPSSRAALPRRTTKGPLDAPQDPLSAPAFSDSSSLSPAAPLSPQSEINEPVSKVLSNRQETASPMPHKKQQPSTQEPANSPEDRDLSFLLDSAIYHALSQVEVPGPFRKPFLPPPGPETPLSTSLQQLDSLLSQCDFLRAAHLAGSLLVSGSIRPTDAKSIFRVLEIRYSCLELSGNSLIAAQEAKSLEDLSSGFYYDEPNPEREVDDDAAEGRPRKVPEHIMPFSLRLQALRLQSMGFSDPRRGVSSLYDVGMECRDHLSSPNTTPELRKVWTERLHEVSIRVVNALIEMGDLDSAARTLEGLKPAKDEELALWTARMALLRIKMGDISSASTLVQSKSLSSIEMPLIESILAISEDRYDDAVNVLSDDQSNANSATGALIKQNLAVAFLYRGEIHKARQLLEELVDQGYSFQTLTVNLATIFDLTSDKSRDLKTSMVSRIASQKQDPSAVRSYANADFKL